MKRVLIYAAAAIVALASCSKTQVVYKDAPEEIGFKAVTGVMTKATQLESTKDLGVFAHLYDNTTDGNEYFGNTRFQHSNNYWTAGKYWPVSNDLIFTVYSPYNGTQDAVSWNATSKTLSFTSGDNSTVGNQTDFLYGTTRPTGSVKDDNVSVELGHALAKITINVSATVDNVVTLTGLSINKTRHNETCTVDYSGNTPTVSWTTTTEDVTSKSALLIPTETQLTSTQTSESYLVVPEGLDQQTITLTYKLAGSNQNLTYTTAVKAGENPNQLGTEWKHGKNYIYNISIGPKEIKFEPQVADWDENTNGTDGDDKTDVSI